MDVPVAIQIPLFLKVMSFDRQLHPRAGSELVVAIAYQSGNRSSLLAEDAAVQSLSVTRGTVDGLTVRPMLIDLDRERLAVALAREHVTMLYVAPLRAFDIGTVVAAARAAHVTTATGVTRYIALGLALSVRRQGDRPRLLINLPAARLEGAEFAAELLKLAEVIQ